jgi:hypothetical protein
MGERCGCRDAPSATGCLGTVEASDAFTWSGAGSELSPWIAAPDLDPDVDNLLTCGVDGLLAQLPASIAEPPACRVFKSTNTSIANDTLTAVTFNVEEYDTDTMHSIAANTGRITFTTAGTYAVSFACAWNKNSTGIRLAEVRKNGTDVLAMESKTTGGADLLVGHVLLLEDDFSAADYVEALVRQTSGGNLALLSESFSPFFSAVKL